MGMTIEEKAIKELNEIIDEGWLISDKEKCTAIDACEFAIDRICKYQKIEEVINRLKNINDHTTSIDLLFEIKEIIEDGQ